MIRYTFPGNAYELFEELVNKDPLHEDVKDERVPYWADLWPSAIALGKYIEAEKENFSGKTTIEIGCGLAIPSIVAGLSGASVTMTDYLDDALKLACENWKLNIAGNCTTMHFDWREEFTGKKFDIVLASDIAYEKKAFLFLIRFLKSILSENGCILLSEPNRPYASEFINLLSVEFNITDIKDYSIRKDEIEYKVSVYKIEHN